MIGGDTLNWGQELTHSPFTLSSQSREERRELIHTMHLFVTHPKVTQFESRVYSHTNGIEHPHTSFNICNLAP